MVYTIFYTRSYSEYQVIIIIGRQSIMQYLKEQIHVISTAIFYFFTRVVIHDMRLQSEYSRFRDGIFGIFFVHEKIYHMFQRVHVENSLSSKSAILNLKFIFNSQAGKGVFCDLQCFQNEYTKSQVGALQSDSFDFST